MERRNIDIAVVEDNGMARINLRNHLLEMDFSGVACFSSGRELRRELKHRSYDLLLMDFHLGDNKNGVEVIQDLIKDGLLKNTTSIIFITSDRLPMIIGQIVDIHPDDLVIKPYTIRSLERTIASVLKIRESLKPVLVLMDKKEYEPALEKLQFIIDSNILPKSRTTLLKLKARILVKLERFDDATALYDSVLDSSEKVIWAKWGKIHAQFLAGKSDISEEMLKDMLGTHLTNDKACEWLARIAINKNEYERAEQYLDSIKESSLSIATAKLRAYVYQVQDKMDEAVSLLERRRQSSRNVREKFAELSLELARCYLNMAEGQLLNEREKTLQVARFLIGSAGRNTLEEGLELKRGYMNILAAILEENVEKAKELLEKDGMDNFEKADVSTMTDAVKAWLGVGDELKASQILLECENKLANMDDLTEKTVSSKMISKSEETLGEKRPRALKFNKQGLELHVKGEYEDSIEYFYQAYCLFPEESAFGINLLQSLVDAKMPKHKFVKTLRLFNDLDKRKLTDGNRKRLGEIGHKIQQDKNAFIIAEPPPEDAAEEFR